MNHLESMVVLHVKTDYVEVLDGVEDSSPSLGKTLLYNHTEPYCHLIK